MNSKRQQQVRIVIADDTIPFFAMVCAGSWRPNQI